MNNDTVKTSETSIRVALLLKELLKTPLNAGNMQKFINNNNKKQVYSVEVLNKYLNTLRTLGLRIKRIDGEYTLFNFLVQISLTDGEISAFNTMEINILKYGSKSDITTFLEIKKRILKYLDANSQNKISNYTEQYLSTPTGVKIKIFAELCKDSQIIKIRHKGITKTVEPRQILFIDNKVYLECYEPKNYNLHKLPIERVSLVKQQPAKIKHSSYKNNVVFEVYDKLIDNYKLKEGERVLMQDKERKVIKTENEDYELLAKRLVRYKNNCKVLKPERFQKYFKAFVDEIYAVYENETI